MASIILNVQFDVGQESQQLNWYFSDAHGKINPNAGGPKTGLLSFQPGDTLTLAISAESSAGQLESVGVIDCNLITLPMLATWNKPNPGTYPMPSPFFQVGSGPGSTVSFMPVSASSATSKRQTFTGQTLTLNNLGRWKLTFMLTVAITEITGAINYRVFTFDPECEVGNGLD